MRKTFELKIFRDFSCIIFRDFFKYFVDFFGTSRDTSCYSSWNYTGFSGLHRDFRDYVGIFGLLRDYRNFYGILEPILWFLGLLKDSRDYLGLHILRFSGLFRYPRDYFIIFGTISWFSQPLLHSWGYFGIFEISSGVSKLFWITPNFHPFAKRFITSSLSHPIIPWEKGCREKAAWNHFRGAVIHGINHIIENFKNFTVSSRWAC